MQFQLLAAHKCHYVPFGKKEGAELVSLLPRFGQESLNNQSAQTPVTDTCTRISFCLCYFMILDFLKYRFSLEKNYIYIYIPVCYIYLFKYVLVTDSLYVIVESYIVGSLWIYQLSNYNLS